MKMLLFIFLIVFVCSEAQLFGLQYPVTQVPILGTTSEDQRDCVWRCPKTPEYNPICGTDGEAYYNISYLRCAQYCGINVQATHPPPCSPTTTTAMPWLFPPQAYGRR